MNRFIKMLFLLMLLSSGLGFGLLAYSNARSDRDRRARIGEEESRIAETFKRVDQQPMHAVFTVEKQETSMVARGEAPYETWGRDVTSTTLLFKLSDSPYPTVTPPTAIIVGGTLSGMAPVITQVVERTDPGTGEKKKVTIKIPGQVTLTGDNKTTVVLFTDDTTWRINGAAGDFRDVRTQMDLYAVLGADGKTATDIRASTPYVERIVIHGDMVTLGAIKLELKTSPEVAGLLAGHVFYLFDTVGGEGDAEPYELNPVGRPPMRLRHTPPGFTDYEAQLWRPIWDMIPEGHENGGRPVLRTKLPAVKSALTPGLLYRAEGYRMPDGSMGLRIDPKVDQGEVAGLLDLARTQDAEAAAGIIHVPGGGK